MQLAGATCAICRRNVMLDSDATWCARCSTVLHHQCLARADGNCPTCRQICDRPETHFVISQQCLECFRPNHPPRAQYAACSARTSWDTPAAFDEFLGHVQNTSRARLIRGLAELFGAVVCLLALIALLLGSRRPGFMGLSLLLLGFIKLTADGLFSLVRSRKIAKFR